MVQNSYLLSSQQLAKTLGQVLPEQELNRCCQQSEIREPTAGKQFWQSTASEPGIYIVIAGKVRLLDRADELLVTLETGASFGESTLFPLNSFQPLSARASVNVQLCFLPGNLLQDLSYSYPAVRSHLEHQAVLRDWLLLCPQIADLRKMPGLMQALSLLERHDLPIDRLPSNLEKQQLWLLRQGQLLHPSGQQLTAGSIYSPSQQSDRSWQVAQPTELYSFTQDRWETALNYLPQLSQLISSEAAPVEEQGRFNPTKVIADNFSTQATKFSEPKNQKKISKAYFPNPTVKVGQLWQRFTRRYPYFQQQSASDCGAACLVMVSR
ncbi:MAG: cyclic nucleotide-binding domain-containing protein, partial [Leptolyngbyaceae cyanobacterium CAN_BIN12]|nr:cyclic nucleotide-binding domain-containing protein [Leptolyngbyaceae cyanobacterium CAN_BIN12]